MATEIQTLARALGRERLEPSQRTHVDAIVKGGAAVPASEHARPVFPPPVPPVFPPHRLLLGGGCTNTTNGLFAEVKKATALLVLASTQPGEQAAVLEATMRCELCGATLEGPKLLTDHVVGTHLRELLAVQSGPPTSFQALVLREAEAIRALLPTMLRGDAAAEAAAGQGDQRANRGCGEKPAN